MRLEIKLDELPLEWLKNGFSGLIKRLIRHDPSAVHCDVLYLIGGNKNITSLIGLNRFADLRKLKVNSTYITTLEGVVFPNTLQDIDFSGTKLTSLTGVQFPENLQTLNLSGTDLNTLDGVNLPQNLRSLNLSGTRLASLRNAILPTHLQELYLRRTNLTSLEGVRFPLEMRELDLSFTSLSTLSNTILPERLQSLDLWKSDLTTLQGVFLPVCLERLILRSTHLESLNGVVFPNSLCRLDLYDTNLKSLIGVQFPTGLQYLNLAYTNLTSLEGVVFPEELKELCLINTAIRKLPESIRSLKKLDALHLSNLKLLELPDWLSELGLPITRNSSGNGIRLFGTTVKDVDMTIFDQSQEAILQWFKERKRQGLVPLNEIKVVFLGNGDVGKSHTIARLLRDGAPPDNSFTGESTPGIAISDKTYNIDGRPIRIHFWDFGGQEILYSLHRMFLTERTIYVILVDARSENRGTQAKEWLDTVKSFAGQADVLLVVNKLDQNPGATLDERGLAKEYPHLKNVIYMSARDLDQQSFNKTLTDAMLEMIRQSKWPKEKWPKNWKQVKDALQSMEEPYIHSRDYQRICQNCKVEKGGESLLNWCNDLGVCFRREDKNLKDYVILRPEWITNAVYTIIFNKRDAVRNGLISLEDIFDLLTAKESRQVLKSIPYSWQDMTYILDVVRKFSLSYPVDHQQEFFPMLCSENSTPVVQEYADALDTLEFHMEFNYLPNNILHRLMVERHRELDPDNVWLTGARFRQVDTNLSVVVRIDGNTLKLYVRSEDPLHAPNTYLSVIAGTIDRICQSLNLDRRKRWLIYKEGGKTASFDYEDLLFAQEMGESLIPCRELRKRIPLVNILKQSGHSADKAQDKLLTDIVHACEMLQDDRTTWNKSEDERTTYIRNLLQAKGYIAMDQSRGGVSTGGEQAGELDLDIRLEPDVRWTIFEALNLSGSTESRLKYWDAHLDKLLDNYNSTGCPFLFHVTYLSCSKDSFTKHCIAFDEHIRWYAPAKFSVSSHRPTDPLVRLGLHQSGFRRVMECVYDCGGIPMTVYHFFVRIGE